MEARTNRMVRKRNIHSLFRGSILWLVVMMLLPLMPAETPAVVTAGEEGLFTPIAPDTVLVLDISASMRLNPLDEMDGNGDPIKLYGNASCSGTTFYNTPADGLLDQLRPLPHRPAGHLQHPRRQQGRRHQQPGRREPQHPHGVLHLQQRRPEEKGHREVLCQHLLREELLQPLQSL